MSGRITGVKMKVK